jgi:hypothetical protein
LALAGLIGAERTALAQEASVTTATAPADDLIARGVYLRKEGRDAEALALFEQAYAPRHSSRAAAQIALAHQALAQWREAERSLLEALSDTNDPWIARQRAHLEESLTAVQAHLASLEVQCNVDGAEVWVGGIPLGHVPSDQALRVVTGDGQTVEVRAPGHDALRQTVNVPANALIHVAFFFVAERTPVPPASEETHTVRPAVALGTPVAQLVERVSLGVAIGLAVTGIGGLVVREREAAIYDDDGRCGPVGALSRYDRCRSNRDLGSAAQTVAVISFAGAGAAAVLSGALLLTESHPRRPAAASLTCSVVGAGAACKGVF